MVREDCCGAARAWGHAEGVGEIASAAEAAVDFVARTARLKAAPFQNYSRGWNFPVAAGNCGLPKNIHGTVLVREVPASNVPRPLVCLVLDLDLAVFRASSFLELSNVRPELG